MTSAHRPEGHRAHPGLRGTGRPDAALKTRPSTPILSLEDNRSGNDVKTLHMHTRQRPGRLEILLACWATLALSGLLVAGCSAGQAGNAAVPLTAATEAPTSAWQTVLSATRQAGSVRGEVTAIEVFADPASQIHTTADLTAYLLPGLSGDGVQCAEDALDPAAILAMPLEEGSQTVTGIILECVDRDDVGSIVAMYAVGLQAEGAERFREVGPCAAAALASDSTKALRVGLASIYLARLDLAAPPTSPDIANEFLQQNSGCLDAPTTTASSIPVTSTAATETPQERPTAANTRSIKWNLLAPGDCLAEVPQGDITTVTVTSCDAPHVTEVVGTSFLTTAEAENGCRNLFKNYTGAEIDSTQVALDILESTSPTGSLRVICLASSGDGQPTTGSLQSG